MAGEAAGAAVGEKGLLVVPELSAPELRRRLHERVPELDQIAHCDLEVLSNCDSAHVGPDEWALFARTIRAQWKRYDGVVVLHGTDTLAYTASALSFLLRPCLKPVVVTGAQRPLAALRTDARRNLISAVEIAARGPRSAVSQVTVFFDELLFQGNRVRKRSASDFAAFESPKASPLAWVGTEIRYAPHRVRKVRRAVPALKPVFSRHVGMLHVTPGLPAGAIARTWLDELDALVLVVYPSGTGPTHDPEFMAMLERARGRVPVVIVTDTAHAGEGGRADPSLYAAGRELLRAGCLWAGEMTPECAYVKTTLVAGNLSPKAPRKDPQKKRIDAFCRLWQADLAGEG